MAFRPPVPAGPQAGWQPAPPASAQQQGQNLNPCNDTQITPALADSISSLCFSPTANVLVATCWDDSAYCWRVDPPSRSSSSYAATALTSTSTAAPLLCSAFLPDGSGAFVGGTDKAVRLWDLSSNQTRQVAAHDAPIKHCAYVPQCNLLITGKQRHPALCAVLQAQTRCVLSMSCIAQLQVC